MESTCITVLRTVFPTLFRNPIMDVTIVMLIISAVVFIIALLALFPFMHPIKFGALALIGLLLCGFALHLNDQKLSDEQRAVARVYP